VRVAVTASVGRLAGLEARLRDAGHEAVRAPLVRTAPTADRAAAERLLGLPWRLYPSRSAVDAWVALGLGFADGARIGAVGPGTAIDLERVGGDVALVARPATATGLARGLLRHPIAPRPGDAVGVVQGDRARSALREILEDAGIEVRTATVYTSEGVTWSLDGRVDAVVLASPSAVAALPVDVGAEALLVAIGPTTAAAAVRRGWSVVQAAEPTVDGVLDAMARCGCGGGR
jgi:uroporphyrinogen-III synthase